MTIKILLKFCKNIRNFQFLLDIKYSKYSFYMYINLFFIVIFIL